MFDKMLFGAEAAAKAEAIQKGVEQKLPAERILSGPPFSGEAGWTSECGPEGGGVIQKECHIEMEGGPSVDIRCDAGGPGSKYPTNEDGYYCAPTNKGRGFTVFVVDGAGGSGKGDVARDIAVSMFRDVLGECESKGREFILFDAFETIKRRFEDGEGPEDGYATGVGVHVFLERDGEYRIEMINRGDSRFVPISKDPEGFPPALLSKVHNIAFKEKGDTAEYYTHPKMNEITSDLELGEEDVQVVRHRPSENPEGFFGLMASDGFFDVVSPYEATMLVQEMHRQGKSNREIQSLLFEVAYARNNSRGPFTISTGPERREQVSMGAKYGRGDNITVALIDMRLPETIVGGEARPPEEPFDPNKTMFDPRFAGEELPSELEAEETRVQRQIERLIAGKSFENLVAFQEHLRSEGKFLNILTDVINIRQIQSGTNWEVVVSVQIGGDSILVHLEGVTTEFGKKYISGVEPIASR